MDGTIVDTEPYWMAAEARLVESYGGTWTHEDAIALVGSGLTHSAHALQAHGVTLSDDEIIESLTTSVLTQIAVRVPWRPGARELLADIAANDVPTALVTMSIRRMAVEVAAALPLPFDVVVAGDDVDNAKPHPEPYLLAAKLLDVAIADCVAIEDSPPGVASAVASGAVVVGVPGHGVIPASDDHVVWQTLAGRTMADLTNEFRTRRTVGAGA